MNPWKEKRVIGGATLYLGDCREILPTLERVDAVVTDPPYGTQELGGGYGRRQLYDKGDGNGRTIANDTDLSTVSATFPLLLSACPRGWIMLFLHPRKTADFVTATGCREWFGSVVWDKTAPGLGYFIRYAHETIAIFQNGEAPRAQRPLISVVRAPSVAEIHPHEKPMPVMSALVDWGSQLGATVLDPFMGSGTTGAACAGPGRRFVGIEIDPTHFAAACARVEEAQRQMDMFIPSAGEQEALPLTNPTERA